MQFTIDLRLENLQKLQSSIYRIRCSFSVIESIFVCAFFIAKVVVDNIEKYHCYFFVLNVVVWTLARKESCAGYLAGQVVGKAWVREAPRRRTHLALQPPEVYKPNSFHTIYAHIYNQHILSRHMLKRELSRSLEKRQLLGRKEKK